MLTELTSFSFSGHETFAFRYPWLKKGYDAVREDPSIFQRDDAITILGVGKNMVRSIRHRRRGRINNRGTRGGGTQTHRFAPRNLVTGFSTMPMVSIVTWKIRATLWSLHWQIASNPLGDDVVVDIQLSERTRIQHRPTQLGDIQMGPDASREGGSIYLTSPGCRVFHPHLCADCATHGRE